MAKQDTSTRMIMGALRAAIHARKVPVLVGEPGTGKTETVRALAKEMDYELITVIGSQMDPTDVTGLPKGEKVLDDEHGNPIFGTVYLAPWWQVRILQNKRIILFLDEFSNTSGAVRASMLTMLRNREFPNGTVMPDETVVIAAMNPTEQAADGYELDLPTTNRLFFMAWDPSISSWEDGMLENWGQPCPKEELDWKRKIVGFIHDQPTYLHQLPEELATGELYSVDTKNPSQMEVVRSAWPSRRSWDDLSKILAHSPDDLSVQDLIARGVVGVKAASAFREWLIANDSIDADEVLANPKKVNWKKMQLDESNLVLRAIIQMINDENGTQVLEVFSVIADQNRHDLGSPYIADLIRGVTDKDKISPAQIKANKAAAAEVLKKFREIGRNSR